MAREHGQATVEWVALVLLMAIVLAGAAVIVEAPWLGRSIRCALLARCSQEALEAQYGEEIAGLVRQHAPSIVFERGERQSPVDFRRCRERGCAAIPSAFAFTRVLDRRPQGGDLFVQYWLFYPDSAYISESVAKAMQAFADMRIPEVNGPLKIARDAQGLAEGAWHEGDWESYQVRIPRSGRALARASAHAGYAGRLSWPNLCEDSHLKKLGLQDCRAWEPATGYLRVSRGSHAGHLVERPGGDRVIDRSRVTLVPYEPLAGSWGCKDTGAEVTMPDCKRVYRAPESDGT